MTLSSFLSSLPACATTSTTGAPTMPSRQSGCGMCCINNYFSPSPDTCLTPSGDLTLRIDSPLVQLYGTSTMEHHHLDHCIMILNSEVCVRSHDSVLCVYVHVGALIVCVRTTCVCVCVCVCASLLDSHSLYVFAGESNPSECKKPRVQ